jgi:hypothetical protein
VVRCDCVRYSSHKLPCLTNIFGDTGTKLKLRGDQLMRTGDYAGAAEAYSRAKESAARTRDSHSKFARARGSAGAFSRVAIM